MPESSSHSHEFTWEAKEFFHLSFLFIISSFYIFAEANTKVQPVVGKLYTGDCILFIASKSDVRIEVEKEDKRMMKLAEKRLYLNSEKEKGWSQEKLAGVSSMSQLSISNRIWTSPS